MQVVNERPTLNRKFKKYYNISEDSTNAVYIANDIVFYMEGQDFTYGEGTEEDEHSQKEALFPHRARALCAQKRKNADNVRISFIPHIP